MNILQSQADVRAGTGQQFWSDFATQKAGYTRGLRAFGLRRRGGVSIGVTWAYFGWAHRRAGWIRVGIGLEASAMTAAAPGHRMPILQW